MGEWRPVVFLLFVNKQANRQKGRDGEPSVTAVACLCVLGPAFCKTILERSMELPKDIVWLHFAGEMNTHCAPQRRGSTSGSATELSSVL